MILLRKILFPFAVVYGFILSLRNWAFDKGWLKSTSFDVPVIAVGNLNVGGTGKTPQIEYLIRLLKNNYDLAVISRGYRRKSKGFQVASKHSSAEDLGDEPYQFFMKFPQITVAVEGDRVHAIKQVLKIKPPNVFLLDDAYQHRQLKAGCYILLAAYDDLYVHDFILPTGNLREGRSGAQRAQIIVVTKCPPQLSSEEQVRIKHQLKALPQQQVFFSTITYADKVISKTQQLEINELKSYQVILVTGIAKSLPLLEFLNERGIDVKHLKYPDHYHFKTKDIEQINSTYQRIKNDKKIILTTEKDYVRSFISLSLEVFYLPIATTFLNQQDQFDQSIINYVQQNSTNG